MSNKILWSKLGSVSRGFQGRAGGGSCGRETESMRGRLVTCGISLLTSSGILCLGIYTCHRAVESLHGKGRLKRLIYSQLAEDRLFWMRQDCTSSQMQYVTCSGKFNACIINNVITLHNFVNGLHFLCFLQLGRLWENVSYFFNLKWKQYFLDTV